MQANFAREKDDSLYNAFNYILLKLTGEALAASITAVAIPSILWFTVGFNHDNGEPFGYAIALLFVYTIVGIVWAIMMSLLLDSPDLSTALTATSFIIQVLFSGFLIRRKSIPEWWSWTNPISFTTYGFAGLLVNEFSTRSYNLCSITNGANYTIPKRPSAGEFPCESVPGKFQLIEYEYDFINKVCTSCTFLAFLFFLRNH